MLLPADVKGRSYCGFITAQVCKSVGGREGGRGRVGGRKSGAEGIEKRRRKREREGRKGREIVILGHIFL